MSTAGKVLTVLILMVVPIWILLVAAVADLNTNGTQAVKRLQEQVARLETQVVANEKQILDLRDQIAFEQTAMDRDRTVIRTQLAEVERARSATIEIKRDVQLQLETIAAALKNAAVGATTGSPRRRPRSRPRQTPRSTSTSSRARTPS